MFEGLIVSQDPYFSALLKERLLRLLPQPANLLIEPDQKNALINETPPGLIIIHLGESTASNLQLLEDYRKSSLNAKFVVFSENSSTITPQQVLDGGANRFFVTPTTDAEWNEMEEEIVTLVNEFTPEDAPVVDDAINPPSSKTIDKSTARFTVPAEVLGNVPPEVMVAPVASQEPTPLPQMASHWRIGLTGDLQSASKVRDLDRAVFITRFIYIRLADISVALEREYFNHIFLHGPDGDQILVADKGGIHHGILETKDANEEQREQFIHWCCEQKL